MRRAPTDSVEGCQLSALGKDLGVDILARFEELGKDRLLELYHQMLTIRKFEDKLYYLFLQGVVPGTLHQYQGQEAVAVGVCAALSKDDIIVSTHRPHGHAIAKGVNLRSLAAELFGRATGCCRGKGGSMHVGDFSVGMPPAIAIVGGGIPIATGAALGFKLKKSMRVAVAFFGDGAANEGAFHEAVNLGAIWNLPVIYVCENNFYGASTHISLVMKVRNVADRAAAYGIPGLVVDGNDVAAVYEAASAAVERARKGDGPTLVECLTYRYCGHSRSDPAKYRPKEELEAWKAKDPIPRFRERLLTMGVMTASDADDIDHQVENEIEEAVQYAAASPPPPPETALEDVFA